MLRSAQSLARRFNGRADPPLENIDLETLRGLDFPGLQVYYSMPLLNYRSDGLRRGEADFVLFHPSHGLLVWEVKGGGVHFENHSWYSTNAQGTHRIKDPISAMEQTRLVTKVLNPSFQLVPSPGSEIDWIEDRLVQLSNQQKWALELLRFVPQLTITGGAGTGKTLLARQKAQDLLDQGKCVLVLCFNQNLGASLRSGLSGVCQGSCRLGPTHQAASESAC